MNLWTIARYLIRFGGLIVFAIQTVEAAADGWTSEEKRDAARKAVIELAKSFGVTLPKGFIEDLDRIIDATVSVFNAIGHFVKSPKAEAPAPIP
jgi:hypothetical protein